MSTTPLSVRVPTALLEKLDSKATENSCSRTDYVLAILAREAGVEVEPRVTVDKIVDSRIRAIEERLAVLEKQFSSAPPSILSLAELAQRLKVNQATIKRRQDLLDFTVWSKLKDPGGWGWSPVMNAYPFVYKPVLK